MADISGNGYGNAREEVVMVNLKDEVEHQQEMEDIHNPRPLKKQDSLLSVSVPFLQKLIAEFLGTYFLVFTGCASVVVNMQNDNVVTLPGIAIVWDSPLWSSFTLLVTSLVLISIRPLPLPSPLVAVPAYVISQVIGSTLAAATLRLLFGLDHDVCSGKHDVFIGSSPVGSDLQAFTMEFIVTFYLMFIISGVATDNRAIGELAGLAIGSTVLLNVLIAAPVSSASMNPGRSLGPALVYGCYKGIWIYLVAPTLGAIAGAWVYNTVRYTDKPLREITKSGSFLKTVRIGST
ncbi:Aquaporin NIP1-1 [Arabidopsis thaliana]